MGIPHLFILNMVEGDKLRVHAKGNKKARTGNYDYSQQKSSGGNFSHSQQKFSTPTPSSPSVPSSKNWYDQKVRAPGSKTLRSVSCTRTYPTCLSVVLIRMSVSQEMKDDLGVVYLVIG